MSGDLASPEDKTRYDNAKKELLQALSKKKTIDRQLAQLEAQIYNYEGSYLTDTIAHSGGNIIQGFDGYLKNQTTGRRKHDVSEADRMFSNSSLTYQKSLDLVGEGEESSATVDDGKAATPGVITINVPAAPKSQDISAAQAKKLRDRDYQRKKRASHTAGSEESESISTSSGRKPSKRARMSVDD